MTRTARTRSCLVMLAVSLFAAVVAGRSTPVGARAPGVAAAAPAGPALTIDVRAGRHAISPNIYGINWASPALLRQLRIPLTRWGGNSVSRYNWRAGVTNTGSDWYFEDVPVSQGADAFVTQARNNHSRAIVTLPMIGWVAKPNAPKTHPYACGYKVPKYGAQTGVDPYDTDCGNGSFIGTPPGNVDPADTSVKAGAAFDGAWVRHLVAAHGRAAHGGVRLYELDNEPSLWNSTHRDVHPSPLTYDELWKKSLATARAVKAADPGTTVMGPVEWGWCAYLFSAADGCGDGSDRQAHGDTPLVPWYLRRFAMYDRAHHTHLLGYLDLHFYPQATGVALSSAGDAATQALRLRSTRALWDPTYVDESWIGRPIAQIRTMRSWVEHNDPGVKTAITEYNWGGAESINGALAEADVLGIFGRERLDLAAYWAAPASTDPVSFAFRMFRNYDGHGHAFGNTWVRSSSGDQGALAVYAAQRASDRAVTIVVINKSTGDLRSHVGIRHFVHAGPAGVYRYSGADLGAIVREPNQPVGSAGFTATFPASSVTLFVIRRR